jgi:hypothetical protein
MPMHIETPPGDLLAQALTLFSGLLPRSSAMACKPVRDSLTGRQSSTTSFKDFQNA